MSQEELNSSAALDSVTDWLERLDDRGDLWQVLVMLTKRKAIGLLRREQAAKRGGGQVRGESALGIPDGMSTAAPGGVEALGRDLFFSAGSPSRANGLRTQFQAKILTQPVNGVRPERRSLTEHEPIKDSRHEAGVADVVFKVIRQVGIALESEDQQGASRFLHPIFERADVSLLNLRSESDENARLKIVCQEAALVSRSLAEFLPTTFETTAALWRIANSILERGGCVLRLSPSELTMLGEITRAGEREAPDEMLLWLMDHVDSTEPNDIRREKESDVRPRGRN